jgi:NAD-dependent DNA ligase
LRGNGLQGQDVSHLVGLGIKGLSKSAKAVRGELILPRSQGVALARSWVNGQIHQNSPSATEIGKIHFVAYEVMGGAMKRSEQFEYLEGNGFEVPWFTRVDKVTEAQLAIALKSRRDTSPYDTDGIVVGLNTVPRSESTAVRARNPKDCVAFKMPLEDQSATTTVRAVLWAPSAQGYIIPRIQFDPVKIGSATIEFCTGHNARMILTNRVGPGAKIVIRRSGDVIPKLDTVLEPATASFPTEGWAWDGDEATAVHIKAVGSSSAIVTARLHHFLKTLEIPGAGPAAAKALQEAGIAGPATLLAATAEKLSAILGPKTGTSLHANVRSALHSATEMSLMQASSVMPRGVGDTKLTSLFAVQPDPRQWSSVAAPEGWTADSYRAFLAEFPNYVEWRSKELAGIPYPIISGAPAPSTGKLICLTGFRDAALEKKAESKGYKLVTVFNKRVSILLVPDGPVKESEKVKAARAAAVPILSRSQFVAQYLA